MLLQQLPYEGAVRNITVNKLIPALVRQAFQVAEISRVRQFVKVDDGVRILLDALQNEIGADESRAPSDKYRIVHANVADTRALRHAQPAKHSIVIRAKPFSTIPGRGDAP